MKKNVFKRFIALGLCVTLLNVPVQFMNAQTVENNKSDLVNKSVEAQGEFVTKGEFTSIINKALDLESKNGQSFKDVNADNPYAKDIITAKEYGYFKGDAEGNVNPNKIISGVEASVAINSILGFDLKEVKVDNSLNVPVWAKPAVSNLIDLTMITKEMAEKSKLTPEDANKFGQAIAVAQMFSDSPYALKQSKPTDDFFNYSNRQFLATSETPIGYPFASTLYDVNVTVDDQLASIMNESIQSDNLTPGSEEWKIKQVYNMYMDNETKTKSLEVLRPIFTDIDNIKSIADLIKITQKYSDTFVLQNLYIATPSPDSKMDNQKWATIFKAGALGLPAKEYYSAESDFDSIQKVYKENISSKLKLVGSTENVDVRAQKYFDFEKKLADKRISDVELNDPNTLYTPATWNEIVKLTANTKIETINPQMFNILKNYNVYCPDKEYIQFADSLYTQENLQVLKDMALISIFDVVGPYIGDRYDEMDNKLKSALAGSDIPELPLEQKTQMFTQTMMSTELSKLYVEKYTTPQLKEDISKLIENVRQKQIARVQKLTWMDSKTKTAAIDKLNSIKANILSPDASYKSNSLKFDVVPQDKGGTLLETFLNATKKLNIETISKLKGPYSYSIWDDCPTFYVNAFYLPEENSITIPAGILQAPLYNVDDSEAEKLGGIGAVIGHELTHAIDNNGSQYDKYGTLTNWWTDKDYATFSKLTESIADELSKIQFTKTKFVNGSLCTGEAVADLGGLACVLDIAEDRGLDKGAVMTAFSKLWATRMSEQFSEYLLTVDVHTPSKVRVNFTLSQQDAFYKTFNVKPTDKMYISPEKRIVIW